MPKLHLVSHEICPYVQRAVIALIEKNTPFERTNIDFDNKPDWFSKISPLGKVPLLQVDNEVIFESAVICEYLDETFPEPALRPATPAGRARMRLWSKFIDEGIFEATREISFSAMFRERMKNMTEEQRQTRFRNVGDPERRARYISTYEKGVESVYVYQGIANYEKMFKAMESDLAGGAQWLCGDRFTLGDINIMPFVARMEYLDLLEVWTGKRPNTMAWWSRAKARPSFVEAIAGKLTADEIAAMKTHGGKIRDRVAQRLAEYLSQL